MIIPLRIHGSGLFPPLNLGLYLQKALAVFFSLLQFDILLLPSITFYVCPCHFSR
jgi:hypothetical protein